MRGRPRAFDRAELLDRAIRLFWRRGYEATSVRDLSNELGIGQSSLYNAFGGKRALFDEAVGVYDREYGGFVEAALADEPSAALALRRILTEAPGRYTRSGEPPGCLVITGDAGTADGEVRTSMAHLRKRYVDLIRAKIEADISRGYLDGNTDAAALASYVMTVLSGLAHRARDGESRHELDGIARIAVAALSHQV
ncbi:TetR/AcrR family transcriptional regulator [Mycobacterium sp. BMJ-28]